MKKFILLSMLVLVSCARPLPIEEKPEDLRFSASQSPANVGGYGAFILRQEELGESREPHFSSATVLPGRGMNIFDLRAHFRSGAETPVFETAPVEKVQVTDRIGASILLDDQILSGKMDRVELGSGSDHARIVGVVEQKGVLMAVTATLKKKSFGVTVIAKNVGNAARAIRVGWNPHFPSSAKLRSVTGEIVEVISSDGTYGVRIRSFSPEAGGFEASRPGKAKNQPVNPRIGIKSVTVKPGESVTYSSEIELFKP